MLHILVRCGWRATTNVAGYPRLTIFASDDSVDVVVQGAKSGVTKPGDRPFSRVFSPSKDTSHIQYAAENAVPRAAVEWPGRGLVEYLSSVESTYTM